MSDRKQAPVWAMVAWFAGAFVLVMAATWLFTDRPAISSGRPAPVEGDVQGRVHDSRARPNRVPVFNPPLNAATDLTTRPLLSQAFAALRAERKHLETIKLIPCIVAFRARHPDQATVRGSVNIQVRVKDGRTRGLGTYAEAGNVDPEFADCYSRAAEWTRASLRVPDEPDADYSVEFKMRLGAFPPEVQALANGLTPDWYDPDRWDFSDEQGIAAPPGWEPVIRRLLKGRVVSAGSGAPGI